MKKVAVLILTIFYLASATGASVNIHYCMGEFSGWELGGANDNDCGSCGMEKKAGENDCCRDEHKIVKVSDDHKSTQLYIDFLQTPASTIEYAFPYLPEKTSSIAETYPVINAPPGAISQRSYIINRSIRI
jgi:hypothetical protein